VCPVKYELGFYIPEDDILHIHRRENLKSHIVSEDNALSFHNRFQSSISAQLNNEHTAYETDKSSLNK
jgi:hypothetical protein